MANLDSVLKSRNITLLTKVYLVKAMGFPIVMYRYESRTIKKAECQRINAFWLWCWRRLLRVPWTARRWNQFHPKGYQPWIFTGRTDAEAAILWLPDVKSQPIWKYLDGGEVLRVGGGATVDEVVGWHHWINGHQFEQTPGDSEGQRSLACCSPCGHKELDTT